MANRPALEQELIAAWAPSRWSDVVSVVGVSAGPDSLALLRAILAVRENGPGEIVVCHVNHQLRGAESEADQRFVEQLCTRLGVRCDVHRVDTERLAEQQGDGLEAAARDARYDCFARSARTFGARYVATAHTADDQIETILQRVIRGTSLAGLAGIPARRLLNEAVTIVRPFLGVRRRQVLDYLSAQNQDFRHDASNQDPRFSRNRIRNELLPLLAQQYNPQVDQALLRLAKLAGEANAVLDDVVASLQAKCVRYCAADDNSADDNPTHESTTAGAVEIDLRPLQDAPDYVVRELFVSIWKKKKWPRQSMGMAQWEQLQRLAMAAETASPPAITLPGSVRAEIFPSAMRLTR